jgi:predicted nuclease of restriction endonuclease-like (RecB) superfamily
MIRFAREYQPQPIVQRAVAQLQKADRGASTTVSPPLANPETSSMLPLVQRSVAQIPWGHNITLMERIKDLPTRLWYARKTLEQGWSRDTLTAQIKTRAHERQGGAVTNFPATLPEVHASLAQSLLKDPYLFDFLTLEEPFHERELETGLLTHIQKFLLELGRGFAFVGRQYRLEVSDRDFYLDLLFYHLHLRCFVVVELKKGDFKPEYAGKMNFYCSVVDDQLRHPQDVPTLGLILCQTKDRILAEYALRDIHKPIGIADYEITRALPGELASSLPSIEAIEAELSRDLGNEEQP